MERTQDSATVTNERTGEMTENRGRNRWKKPRGDDLDVEYLQTKIAYLEAENNFLRNLKTKTKN